MITHNRKGDASGVAYAESLGINSKSISTFSNGQNKFK
jgi:hypothetical protein